MIYVESIERDRFMPLEIFRRLADQASWTDERDELVLNVGRTLRLGPHPAYMAFWRCPGLGRLDEWEAHFNGPAALDDVYERASLASMHMPWAGCYDELIVGARAEGGLQYIEYFDAPREIGDGAVARHFEDRAARQPRAVLNHVVRRIGPMGPSAVGDMAVWTVADYVALEPLARETHAPGPCRPHAAGIYRAFGKEIL
jgi:hypothetical protein